MPKATSLVVPCQFSWGHERKQWQQKKFPVLVAKSVRLGSLFCFVTRRWYGVGLFIPFGEKGFKEQKWKMFVFATFA